jgi:hypothetical protein
LYRRTHCDIYILVGFTPSIILPPRFLEQFQQVSLVYFHMYIQSISTIPPVRVSTPLLLISTPRKDLFFPPALHFLKIKGIIGSPRGFALVLRSAYNVLLSTQPPSLLFLYHHAYLMFNSLLCSASYYIQISMASEGLCKAWALNIEQVLPVILKHKS